MYKSEDEQGKEFIEAIHLNRKRYITIRQKIFKYQKTAEEKLKNISKLINKTDDEEIKKCLLNTIEECNNIICSGNSYLMAMNESDEIEELFKSMASNIGSVEVLNWDYNIDYSINNGEEKFVHLEETKLNFQYGVAYKYINNYDLKEWLKLPNELIVVFFDKESKQFYFAKLPKQIDSENRTQVTIFEKDIFNENIWL